MREYLVRLIYCQMLGVECAWGHIYAVKFTQNNNIIDKRIGMVSIYWYSLLSMTKIDICCMYY